MPRLTLSPSPQFRVQVVAPQKDKGLRVTREGHRRVQFAVVFSEHLPLITSPWPEARQEEDQIAKYLHTFKIHLTFPPPQPEQLQISSLEA